MGLVPGTLTIAATPIGNPQDASSRLVAALADAELIAAEDTRRLRRLAGELGVELSAKIVSLFEGNEVRRTAELLAQLSEGVDVLLVSDAGMPTVSDPGYQLVSGCGEADIDVTVIPGPSAVLAALAVSGLPTDRFVFDGFLPRKSGQRRRQISELATLGRTVVLFESPRRVGATLKDLAEVLGPDRPAAVCRELTKTYEEIRRGTLAELADWAQDGLLGEVVIVVGGVSSSGPESDPTKWISEVAELVESGMSRRDAAAQIAAKSGVSRRVVYNAVLAADA
jgi:16S rRNA (cytidine1402-2'-O)-methyltransferase